MATFTAVLRKKKKPGVNYDENYLWPIFIRVSTADGDSYKSIGSTYKSSEDNWDKEAGYIKKHKDKDYMAFVNSRIDKFKGELRKKYLTLEAEEQKVRPSDVTSKEKGTGSDFIEYFEQYVKTKSNIGSRKRFDSVLTKLKEYSPKLPLKKLNADFLKQYEVYLREEMDNMDGTIRANMKAIQEVYKSIPQADALQDPWKRYKKPKEKERKDYLDEWQIERLAQVMVPKDQKRYILQQMFLFACYNCGTRVSDLLLMETSNVKDDRIVFDIKKTPKVHSIPLFPKGKEIISQFAGASRWVFPLLEEGLNLSDKAAVNRAISNATAVYNTFLKELAVKAELDGVKFSSHLARHTFATMALKKGMRIEYIAKLLGISLRQAQRYAKIIDLEVENKAREIFG